jgi:hypothetical protein
MRKNRKRGDSGREKIFGKFCRLLRVTIKKWSNPRNTDESKKPV